MSQVCGVCHDEPSKYKCPVCELRYCSLDCYKNHKPLHAGEEVATVYPQERSKRDRPGTNQRTPKVDFTGFENDVDFKRLLGRYPLLKVQLQAVYGLTLEPGPDEARSWNRQPLPGDVPTLQERSGRGRGRGRGYGRRSRGGRGRSDSHQMPEDRQRGPWTQEKGDKEALTVVKKMRSGDAQEKTDGMQEFIQLCQIKFGSDRAVDGVAA